MTILKLSEKDMFEFRDSLYPSQLGTPVNFDNEQAAVFCLMVDHWLETNVSTIPYTVRIQTKPTTDAKTTLMFASPTERDAFETWKTEVTKSKTILPSILIQFDVNSLLDHEDSLGIAGRVTHVFTRDYDKYQPENLAKFIVENYDICFWLIKNNSLQKGKRIWYDFSRSCFFFEDGAAAVNFKLKFTVDDQLSEKKRTISPSPKTRSSWDDEYAASRYDKKSYPTADEERHALIKAMIDAERRKKHGY